VFGLRANNEKLPFNDEEFDCYLANLSLNLVINPKNQIKEAYRVLKNGSLCGMSIWGRKENCKYYSVLNDVLRRNGLTEFSNTARFLEDV
jgi:ubiquinone/menaquinone biosynthesis C-methylase UbiE